MIRFANLLSPLKFYKDRLSVNLGVRQIFCLALIGELVSLAYYFYYFAQHHYLSAPFSIDKNDVFMDFYHPLYWALRDEFYTTFHSVYPALNLFLLKLLGWNIDLSNVTNAFDLRASHPDLTLVVCGIYLGVIALVVNLGESKKLALIDRALFFWVCALSAPVLFASERGNLIFFALAMMALYLTAQPAWKQALYLGILINIKPYFLVLLIQYLNYKNLNKKMIFYTIFYSGLIFCAFGFLAGLDFIEFFKSYFLFAGKYSLTAEGVVGFAHNLSALARIKELIYYGQQQHFNFWFSLLKVISPLSILFLLYLSLRNPLDSLELLIASIVVLTNFSVSTGGYILVLYIVLIPYLIFSREYHFLLLPILMIFALPLDWINLFSVPFNNQYSYLGNAFMSISKHYYEISAGSVVRPLLNFSILSLFSIHLARKYRRVK